MNKIDEMIYQIKVLSLSITEENYFARVQEGYRLLIKLHDLDIEKEYIHQALFQYYNSLEDNLSCDYIGDILDYVVGWCSPQYRIWNK